MIICRFLVSYIGSQSVYVDNLCQLMLFSKVIV